MRKSVFGVLAVPLVIVGLLVAFVQPAYAIDIITSPAEDLTDILGTPNEDGFVPCAAFDVEGWGDKWINLSDFPACQEFQPYLSVQCFTGEGAWTDTTVHEVAYHPMSEVDTGPVLTFHSTQHGTCGIFPTGEHLLVSPAPTN